MKFSYLGLEEESVVNFIKVLTYCNLPFLDIELNSYLIRLQLLSWPYEHVQCLLHSSTTIPRPEHR